MNAAMAAGDSRAAALAEESSRPSKTSTRVLERHERRVRHAEWTGGERPDRGSRSNAHRQGLEVAPWMRLSVHYRRGELEEAREILRGEINKILRAVNFDGRKTCPVVWYLTRVLGEELEAIPAGERTPEESRLFEAIQRAL